MIDRENFSDDDENIPGQNDQELNDIEPKSLEDQERTNSENLVQRLNEDDSGDSDSGSEAGRPIGSDKPINKNLLGDNPPGSEQAAFEAGNVGDMGADQVKYQAENIVENFRENLDKTQNEIELDKKLKSQSDNQES
ncbi:hypothetical protein [Desertivirga xinjiangensis]|uniref:hypothetical protein n=1 Tax=Desertivirga xinjiangensis TaxID=539206 RepID=UPI00210A7B74|nr:hypothetical protein [Pedobacter xinjiangensis]